MRILITGYKGFIGQNMVNALVKDHDLALYEWGDGIVSLDGIDRVIHLGAISSTTCTDEQAIRAQNVDFSIDLISCCVEKNIPIQVASSASVYGPNNTTFLETDQVDPRNLYAKSKVEVETFCAGLNPQSPVQLFRYFNVYGPHEEHKGNQASPYHKFREQAVKQDRMSLFVGSESFYRDFVPVELVVEVHRKFFNISESGVWNVGTGRPKSFLDVAVEVGGEINWIEMPSNLMTSYQKYTCANIEKLEHTLQNDNSQGVTK
jgi:ADP-L-glycero-D-manno-heptose 6-epimerase